MPQLHPGPFQVVVLSLDEVFYLGLVKVPQADYVLEFDGLVYRVDTEAAHCVEICSQRHCVEVELLRFVNLLELIDGLSCAHLACVRAFCLATQPVDPDVEQIVVDSGSEGDVRGPVLESNVSPVQLHQIQKQNEAGTD